MQSKTLQATRFIVYTGVLAAMATVLYFIEFPVIPGLSFLKFDPSDLPAAVAGVVLGPAAAVLVEFLKCSIHLLVRGFGDSLGFGDLMNFLVGVSLTVPLSAVLRRLMKTGRDRFPAVLLAGAAGMAGMVAAGVVFNFLIDPPYIGVCYHTTLSSAALWSVIGGATVLNLVKSVENTALVLLLLPAVRKIIPSR